MQVSDGAAVCHPGLLSIPVEQSIEPWVRQCFPHARYEKHTARAIAPLDMAGCSGLIVLQAAKGMGKSKAIRAGVAGLPPGTTAVQITFRRSLAWASNFLLGADAALYSDIHSHRITASEFPRLTIVVNSVARLKGELYDVVVIDEVVSVMDMLASSLLTAAERVEATFTLARLVAEARLVVVADAMLDASVLDFVLTCRRLRGIVDAGKRTAPPPPPPTIVLDYTHRLHGDYVFLAHASYKSWLEALGAALAAGKNVAVPCMTKRTALNIAKGFAEKGIKVRCYTGDTDPEVMQADMRDIHGAWRACQLLVYSPVITAGCSFEETHFREVFFYGCGDLSSPRSAAQMIARVRDVGDKRIHVFITGCEGGVGGLEDAAEEGAGEGAGAARTLYYQAPGRPDTTLVRLQYLLARFHRVERANSRFAFAANFWALVVHSGARIGFPREDLTTVAAAALGLPPPLQGATRHGVGAQGPHGHGEDGPAAQAHSAIDDSQHDSQHDGDGEAVSSDDDDVFVGLVEKPDGDPPDPDPPYLLQLPREPWTVHNWDRAVSGLVAYPLSGPLPLSGKTSLLQRVACLHPDHVLDLGMVEGLRGVLAPGRLRAINAGLPCPTPPDLEDPLPPGAGFRVPEWCGGTAAAPRFRRWLALMAMREIGKSDVAVGPLDSEQQLEELAAAAGSGGLLVLEPQACMGAPPGQFATQDTRLAVGRAAARFRDVDHPAALVAADAWVLAAVECAMLEGTLVQPSALAHPGFTASPEGVAEAVALPLRLAADMLTPLTAAWTVVRIQVPAGDGTPGGTALLDCCGRDAAGAWHVAVIRTSGCPVTTGPHDLLKALVLADALEVGGGPRATTVTVAWLHCNQQVCVPRSSPGVLYSALQAPVFEPWALHSRVLYALVEAEDAEGGTRWCVSLQMHDGARYGVRAIVALQDVIDCLVHAARDTAEEGFRWIVWCTRPDAAAGIQAAVPNSCNLAQVLARVAGGVALDCMKLSCARAVVKGSLMDVPPQAPGIQHLVALYRGLCANSSLVYFWESPLGLSLRSVLML